MKAYKTKIVMEKYQNLKQGEEARRIRKKEGYSLREIAKAMGISAPYLSDLELGRRGWSDKLIETFSRAIGK